MKSLVHYLPAKSKVAALLLLMAFGGNQSLLAQTTSNGKPLYMDVTKPVDQRVADLMARMTLEEKAQYLNHVGPDIQRFDIRSDKWNQSLHGVVWNQQPGPQRTTFFPVSIAMGASWDTKLMNEVATAISDEARAIYNWWRNSPSTFPTGAMKKGLIYRSPVINVERNPYWGRNEEAYSEDPYLTGRMGVAHVQGLQGNDPKYLKLASTLKHYAVNNVEYGRQGLSASVSERMLHEYWLPHFKDAIVEGKAQSVMASYNAINGIPSNINKIMLNDILRDKWGFKGFVVSDLGGVRSMVNQHTGGKMTYEDAVAQSIIAGCDFSDAEYMNYLPSAVRQGKLPEAGFNNAVARVMRVRFLLGEFDPFEMVPYSNLKPDVIGSKEHLALALKAAQKGVVLLTNTNNALPVNKTSVKTVAVIGPMADIFTVTGYSGLPMEGISPLQGIKNRVVPGTEVLFAKGSPMPPASRNPNPAIANVGGQLTPTPSAEGRAQALMNGNNIIALNMTPEQRLHGYTVAIEALKALDAASTASPEQRLEISKMHEQKFIEVLTTDQKTAYTSAIASRPATVGFAIQGVGGGQGGGGRSGQNANTPAPADEATLLAEAAEIAKRADVVFLYLGTNSQVEREGSDRTSLLLPGNQEELFKTVKAANPKTVVVLMNSGPITMPYVKENAAAMIEGWWSGEQGANAIADVLFGDVNPGGKLPHTIYASDAQVPSQDEYDVTKGFTYMYINGKPLFPFGHGLSYTTFEFSNLKLVSPKQINASDNVTVSFNIKNTGKIAGDEVAQLYIHEMSPAVKRPIKELRGFERVSLNPGQTKTVTLTVPGNKLAYWDERVHDFVVNPGAFEIMVGNSSENTPLKTLITVTK